MAADSPNSLDDLTHTTREPRPWLLDLVQRDIGGGKLTMDRLVPELEAHPEATGLFISGLDQPLFETFVRDYGRRFAGIYLWKCPRIADLTPLEDLPKLRYLAVYWNQRATHFWDFSRNPELRGIDLEDFTRVPRLDDLARATTLEELNFGDMIWPSWVYESLEPVGELTQLKAVGLSAKRIVDGRIQPLGRLQALERINFPANLFTTRQVAWLRARLPESLVDEHISPLWDFRSRPIVGAQRVRDILIVGKRKPWLDSSRDGTRIDRYVAEFQAMVTEFREHPEAEPD